VEDGARVPDGLASDPVRLQLPEEPLDVIGPDRLDPPTADRVTDVDTPDALVALGSGGAQILPAVLPPAGDGVVERGRWAPLALGVVRYSSRRLVLLHDQPRELLLSRSPRPTEQAALVADMPRAVTAEEHSELPGVGTSIWTSTHAPGHRLSLPILSPRMLGQLLGQSLVERWSPRLQRVYKGLFGARDGIRTHDLRITSVSRSISGVTDGP
jgi:hypothetical protein